MITISINGSGLDLEDDFNIRYDIINSIFNNEFLQGSYSFPITLGWTDNNLKILGLSHIVEIAERKFEYEKCALEFSGIALPSGMLVVDVFSRASRKITGYIKTGISGLALMKKKLSEINYGGDIPVPNILDSVLPLEYDQSDNVANSLIAHAYDVCSKKYPEVNYSFPCFKNENFYGPNSASNSDFDIPHVINPFDLVAQVFLKNVIDDIDPNNFSALVPWPYLFFVLQKGFSEEGFSLKGNFIDDEEFMQLCIYSNRALDKKVDTTSVLVQHTADTIYPGTPDWINFDDDTTSPNHDANGVYDVTVDPSYYTIQREGWHRVKPNLLLQQWPYSANVREAWLRLYKDATLVQTVHYPAFGNQQLVNAIMINYFTAADIGKKLKIEIQTNDTITSTPFIYKLDATGYSIYPATLQINNTSFENLNRFDKVINIANHVPDITFGELLARVRNVPNLDIDINWETKSCTINLIDTNLGKIPDADWTKKAQPGYEINREENKGYTLGYELDSTDDELPEKEFPSLAGLNRIDDVLTYATLPSAANLNDLCLVLNTNKFYRVITDAAGSLDWEYYSDNYYDIIIGEGENKIKPKAMPLLMENLPVKNGTALIPYITQKGSSPEFGLGDNKCDLRLMFYRGFQPGTTGGYPLASPTRYIYGGSYGPNPPNYELRHDGVYGLYELQWFRWLAALAKGEMIKWEILFDAVDITGIKTGIRKTIDYVSYIPRKISFVATMREIKKAVVELIKF